MDVDDLFVRASSWAATKVDGVTAEQLDDPTILPGWRVRDLLNHLIGQNRFFAAVAKGETAEPPAGGEPVDLFGSDPGVSYREATTAAREAFSHQEALDRRVSVPAGEMTGAQFWAAIFTEALIHGWDLAKSTGQDASFDAGIANAAYEVLSPIAEGQRQLGFYGPEVLVPSDAPIQDRLLGLVGRSPSATVH